MKSEKTINGRKAEDIINKFIIKHHLENIGDFFLIMEHGVDLEGEAATQIISNCDDRMILNILMIIHEKLPDLVEKFLMYTFKNKIITELEKNPLKKRNNGHLDS